MTENPVSPENPVTATLADANPLPAELPERLRTQLNFLIEIDALKYVLRQSPLVAVERRENDAEHSWHLAMSVLLLAEYSDEPIDIGHTVELVLIHDLIEIYAGDTPLYDTEAGKTQVQRELAAADQLFTQLPADQAKRIRALWDEFEARETPEARFAKAMDRMQPILLNWMARGGTWATHHATVDQVLQRTSAVADASTLLDEARRLLITHSATNNWLA